MGFLSLSGGGVLEAVKHGIDRTDARRGPTLLLSHLESVPRLYFGTKFWIQFLLSSLSVYHDGREYCPDGTISTIPFHTFPLSGLYNKRRTKIVGRTTTPVQRQPHSNSLTTVSRHSLQQATILLCDRAGFFSALALGIDRNEHRRARPSWQRAAISKMSGEGMGSNEALMNSDLMDNEDDVIRGNGFCFVFFAMGKIRLPRTNPPPLPSLDCDYRRCS